MTHHNLSTHPCSNITVRTHPPQHWSLHPQQHHNTYFHTPTSWSTNTLRIIGVRTPQQHIMFQHTIHNSGATAHPAPPPSPPPQHWYLHTPKHHQQPIHPQQHWHAVPNYLSIITAHTPLHYHCLDMLYRIHTLYLFNTHTNIPPCPRQYPSASPPPPQATQRFF